MFSDDISFTFRNIHLEIWRSFLTCRVRLPKGNCAMYASTRMFTDRMEYRDCVPAASRLQKTRTSSVQSRCYAYVFHSKKKKREKREKREQRQNSKTEEKWREREKRGREETMARERAMNDKRLGGTMIASLDVDKGRGKEDRKRRASCSLYKYIYLVCGALVVGGLYSWNATLLVFRSVFSVEERRAR